MKYLILSALICIASSLSANDSLSTQAELTDEQYQLIWELFKDSVEQTLVYDSGSVSIKSGLATFNVPSGYKFLNPDDSDMIITDIWGNPPAEGDGKSLGMIIPKEVSPLSDSSFAINITFASEGFVKDKDAKKLDFTELLETMQEDTRAYNATRIGQGYMPIELIRWASPPYYDSENKKLHWAKELKFGEMPTNTLNYNIRILGRKGYLELNAIGDIAMLEEVKSSIDPILENINFTDGNKYSDFNPKIDKIAAYGIGGLIAGKVLAKAGILAKLGLVLAKFWKFIAIGLVAFFAGFKKLFGGKKEESA